MPARALTRRFHTTLREEIAGAVAGAVGATAFVAGFGALWLLVAVLEIGMWVPSQLTAFATWLGVVLALLLANVATAVAVAIRYVERRPAIRVGALGLATAGPIFAALLIRGVIFFVWAGALPPIAITEELWILTLGAAIFGAVGLLRSFLWSSVGREDGDQAMLVVVAVGLCFLFPPLVLLVDALVFASARAAWHDAADRRARREARAQARAAARQAPPPPAGSAAPAGSASTTI